MGRGFDHDMDDLRPTPFPAQFRHAASTQGQSITSLGSTGDGERLWTMQRRYFNLGTEGCLGKGNWYLAMNLRTVTLEEFVGSHMDNDIEITGWPAVIPFLSFASQAQARAIVDSSRDLDGEFFGQLDYANTATFRTWISDPYPFSTAGRTGGAQRKKSLPPFDLTETAAGVAGDRTLAWGRALPQTVAAGFKLLKLQDFFHAKHGFLEGQLHVIS